MNDQASNPNANPATATVTGLDDRAADLLAELNATPDTGDATEAAEPAETVVAPATEPAKDEPVAAGEPDKHAARKARLAALAEKSAARVRESQERETVERSVAKARELEDQLRMKTAEFEALRDPEKFFDIARKNGVDAEQLAEFLRTGKASQAKPAQDETSLQLQKRIDEMQARIDAMSQQDQSRTQAAQRAQVEREFFSAVAAVASDYPLVTAMRADPKFGDESLLQMAYAVVQTLPGDATYEDVAAEIEEQLESFASLRGASPVTKPTPKTAAAKAPALTNRHAAASTSVDNEDSPRSLEERVALTNEWLRSARA